MAYTRVALTDAAKQIIDQLREQKKAELMFHQSGGCCDGSQPMCYVKGDFKIGSSDVWIGKVHGCDFFMASFQFDYWQYTHLTLDITQGRGSSFSIEIPLGIRFIIHSRLFTEAEQNDLEPIQKGAAFETYS